jgi:transposase
MPPRFPGISRGRTESRNELNERTKKRNQKEENQGTRKQERNEQDQQANQSADTEVSGIPAWVEEEERIGHLLGQARRALTRLMTSSATGGEFDPQLEELRASLQMSLAGAEARQAENAHRRGLIEGQVCAHVAHGHTLADAARLAGVTYATVNRWRRTDPTFSGALRAAEEGARPSPREHWRLKMTASTLETLLGFLRSGMTRSEAAAGAGISRQTFYTWMKRAPEFGAAVATAEGLAAAQRARAR